MKIILEINGSDYKELLNVLQEKIEHTTDANTFQSLTKIKQQLI